MLTKKKHIYLAATLIFVSGLFFDISIGRDEAMTFKKLLWDCPYLGDENYCEVSFQIVNNTPAQQVRKITIHGIRLSPGGKDENAQICGQIDFSILLEPRETIAIRELMPVSPMPDKITVSIRE
jgi:hypothetical protein